MSVRASNSGANIIGDLMIMAENIEMYANKPPKWEEGDTCHDTPTRENE